MNDQTPFTPVSVFKALGDDLRLAAILLIHQQGKLCVCELMAAFAAPQPKVSRHLASLREAGLLATERRGQWVYYYLNPDVPGWVMRVLDETARHHSALIAKPVARLAAMADRPAVQCS